MSNFITHFKTFPSLFLLVSSKISLNKLSNSPKGVDGTWFEEAVNVQSMIALIIHVSTMKF